MNRTKKAGLSVKSGLSLMCVVCLLCGLLCGFFWLAGESSALAAGPRLCPVELIPLCGETA